MRRAIVGKDLTSLRRLCLTSLAASIATLRPPRRLGWVPAKLLRRRGMTGGTR
jgi:hypothetical protein